MTTLYEKIYNAMPIAVQNAGLSLYGRKLIRQRFGAHYKQCLGEYLAKDYSTAASEYAFQVREIRRLINYAQKNSPFYRKLYKGRSAQDIRSIIDLTEWPLVEKEVFRERIRDIYTIPFDKGIVSYTGGTTGKALKVVFAPKDFQRRLAYLDAFKIRCGVDPFRDRKATFSGRIFATGRFQGGRKIFWRSNYAYRQRLYSTFDLKDEHIGFYVDDLNKYAPEIVNGFVSAIHLVAKYILNEGIQLAFQPKAIFTTSESLLPHHRRDIESAFRTRVFNQYASAEGAPFITECIDGSLHYNLDTGVIETFESPHGSEMLVTSFTSYGTPLIRYRIGDNMTLAERGCSCGSAHPVVEKIEGRSVDYLYSSSGNRVSLSHLADVIKGLPNSVMQMQFVQTKIDSITVRMVVEDALFDETAAKKITEAMHQRFGAGTDVTIEKVSDIARESSGKIALIKNCVRAVPE